ncbi:MAG: hypothetical protein ABWY45_22520 [Mycobacterium sp.]
MAPRILVVLIASASVFTASCTRYVDAEPVASDELSTGQSATGAAECAEVDAPLTDIESVDADDPVLRIPQPAGWERYSAMDNEVIRFTMTNVDLTSENFAPTVVVTLESRPGIATAAEVFDAQRESLVDGLGATDVTVAEEKLCGLPAEWVEYTTPPMGAVGRLPAQVMMAVLHTGNRTYAATVTSQTKDPLNPRYQDETAEILRGFQMLAPPE